MKLFHLFLNLLITPLFVYNCAPPSIGNKASVELDRNVAGFRADPGASATPTNTSSSPSGTPSPTVPSGNGTANGAGEAPGCTGTPGTICEGGWGSDATPKNLLVKVVYGNPPGARLVTNPLQHARDFIAKVNQNYVYNGHRYMNLVLDENKVIEVDQKSDAQMIAENAEQGYSNFIFVSSIPGNTVGYVNFMCADLSSTPVQTYAFFEIAYVAKNVVEHEVNHEYCFPHTDTANGNSSSFFLSGYNWLKDILTPLGAYKKPFTPPFKIFVDPANNPNTKSTNEGMVFATRTLMYHSVLTPKAGLFTNDGIGFPYSYSHILDYYYWNFIKPHAKVLP